MERLSLPGITAAPHLHEGTSTARIMLSVVLCLLPAGAWGVLIFGIRALYVILTSVAASLLSELVIAGLLGRFTLSDGSAALTGLLVGYNMPAAVPLYIPAIASAFAIAVVKMTFGGLGRNWMNPALGARVFVLFSWTGPMTTWQAPVNWPADAASGASPLGLVKSGLLDFQGGASGPIELLASKGYPASGQGTAGLGGLGSLLAPLGRIFPAGYGDLFLGNIPGSIGEVSVLLLALGSIYLFVRKIISWEIPASYLASFGLLIWMFGGRPFGAGFFRGDVLFHLFTGGLVLGALYMATDMATSPLTRRGMIIFGLGCGFLTFLIRIYGSLPEGVSLAIILMNMFVPLINKLTRPVKFGAARESRA